MNDFHREHQPATLEELGEKDKHEKLIGQLKAAESRNRIRIMRLRYESNRVGKVFKEIQLLGLTEVLIVRRGIKLTEV